MGAAISQVLDSLNPDKNEAEFAKLKADIEGEVQIQHTQIVQLVRAQLAAMEHGHDESNIILCGRIKEVSGMESYVESKANPKVTEAINAGFDSQWQDMTTKIVGVVFDTLIGSFSSGRQYRQGFEVLFNGNGFVVVLYGAFGRAEIGNKALKETKATSTAFCYAIGIVDEAKTNPGVLQYLYNQFKNHAAAAKVEFTDTQKQILERQYEWRFNKPKDEYAKPAPANKIAKDYDDGSSNSSSNGSSAASIKISPVVPLSLAGWHTAVTL